MLLVAELLQPIVHSCKGIRARGIKEHQRKVDLLKKQRVNWPEIGLTSKVPQHRLALCTVVANLPQFIYNPELLTMCRLGNLKATLRNSIAEARLAHCAIAHQRNFCRVVVHRVNSR